MKNINGIDFLSGISMGIGIMLMLDGIFNKIISYSMRIEGVITIILGIIQLAFVCVALHLINQSREEAATEEKKEMK